MREEPWNDAAQLLLQGLHTLDLGCQERLYLRGEEYEPEQGGQRTNLTPMRERVELLRQAELLRAYIAIPRPSTFVTCITSIGASCGWSLATDCAAPLRRALPLPAEATDDAPRGFGRDSSDRSYLGGRCRGDDRT